MKPFLHAHATHPDWRLALALAAAQIDAQRSEPGASAAPTLGWVYFSDHYGAHAVALLAELHQRWPGVQWVGASGVGVAASGVEYFDEPALVLMLAEIPRDRFRVFSGARPLGGFKAHTANVHADPAGNDPDDLVRDMSARTTTGYLFGGLASSRGKAVHIAEDVLSGGLSGVAFDARVALVSRVTQGCQPIGSTRTVTAVDRNVVTMLDGEGALDCLLRDLQFEGSDPRAALPALRQTLVGLSDAPSAETRPAAADAGSALRGRFDQIARREAFGTDTRVRHLIGLDPGRRGIAIGDMAEIGSQIAFCARNTEAARRDLMRICAEVREEVEPETLPVAAALAIKGAPAGHTAPTGAHGIAGALYISCAGRGGAHFGAPSAELAIVKHALGDVPLVGFFASGEIAREHLYGYTGVLTVFTTAP